MKLNRHSLRRMGALTRKEFFQLMRDQSSLLMGIVLPLILILIMGYGMSLDVKNVPTAIVLEDPSPTARQMVNFTEGSAYFSPVYVRSMQTAETLLAQHDVDAIIRVPQNFAADVNQGTAKVQVILNGTEATTAMSAQRYIEAAVLTWETGLSVRSASAGQATTVSRIWFNDANTSAWFFVPGILMLVLTTSGVFLTSVVMAREWERGTFESLFVTPIKIGELILAKVLPYFAVAVFGMILCLIAGNVLYDLPMRGSLILLIGVSMLYLIISLGIGLVISALTKNQFLACQVSLMISFLPSVMLSGFLFDLHSQPLVIQIISQFLPTTYYLQLMKTLFLAGNYWPLIIRNGLILLGFAILFIGLAFRMTRKEME